MRLINEAKTLILGNRKFKLITVSGRYELFWDIDRKKFVVKLGYYSDPCYLYVFSWEEKEEVEKVLKNLNVSFDCIPYNKNRSAKAEWINPISFTGYPSGFPAFKILVKIDGNYILERVLDSLRELGYKTNWNLDEESDMIRCSSIRYQMSSIIR